MEHDAPDFAALLGPAVRAAEVLARLDERLKVSAFGRAIAERFLVEEALAWQLAEGDLVHREDLVRLEAHVFTGMPYAPLSRALHTLNVWRSALQGEPMVLLRAPSPGVADTRGIGTQSVEEAAVAGGRSDAMRAWREVLRETECLPPILAAAMVWDAWCQIGPEEHGAWKAALLSGLLLRARGLTKHYLLPLDIARRSKSLALPKGEGRTDRLALYLLWAAEAGEIAMKEAVRLIGVETQLRGKVSKARKHSSLGRLVELFLAEPVVTVPMMVSKLAISKQAAGKLVGQLSGYIEELTDRPRYRAWRLR